MPIPPTKRRDSKNCSVQCRNKGTTRRYNLRHPDRRAATQRRAFHRRYYADTVFRLRIQEKERVLARVRSYGYDPGENPLAHKKDRFRHARAEGYRSGLEVQVARQLEAADVAFQYETLRLPYIPPPKKKYYRPDFILLTNGIVVETKGRFLSADRQKHLHIQAQHPDVDIRLVFSNANAKIGKKSNTTYRIWCETKGIPWAEKQIPAAWLKEPPNKKSLAALRTLGVIE